MQREQDGGWVRNSREQRGAFGVHGNSLQPEEKEGLGIPVLEILKNGFTKQTPSFLPGERPLAAELSAVRRASSALKGGA